MSTTVPAALLWARVGIWESDPIHSTIAFSAERTIVSTPRTCFETVDARLTVTDDGVAILSGTVRCVASDRRPELRFASTSLRRTDDRIALHGHLTVKGRTLPITAHGTVMDAHQDAWGTERMGVELRTVVDRRRLGLEWHMLLPEGSSVPGHEVALEIKLEFTRAA